MVPSRPVRVLHFLPDLSRGGGMANVVMNYYRHLDPEKVTFDFLGLNRSSDVNFETEIRGRGGAFFYLSDYGASLRGSIHAFFEAHMGSYDILHCHPIFGSELLGRAALRAGIQHVIAHSHSTRYSDKPDSALRNRLISYFVGAFATDYIACGNDARVLLHAHGRGAYIMHNAIECDRFAFDADARMRLRTEMGVDENAVVFGTVGRLSPEKNQTFLLDLAAALMVKGLNFKLVLIGDGGLSDDLKGKARDLGVEGHVIFLGSRSDVDKFYSAFDAFLLPSVFEGLPVSAVEAQVSGLPCFLSDSITKEAAFGDCSFISISDANAWISALAFLEPSAVRTSRVKEALAAGFEINEESRKLEDHYRQIAFS